MDNEELLHIDLRAIIRLVFRRLWVIIPIVLISAIVTAYYSIYKVTPVYQSKATLYVMQKYYTDILQTPSYDDIMVSQQMLKDYSEILKSTRVTKAVIDNLGITNMTPAELAGKLSITLKNETNLLEIMVTDDNPYRAKDIANTVSEVLIEKIREITNQDNISIVDTAQQPLAPVPTKGKLNIVIAAVAAFLASIILVFLLEYLDNTVKTVEDVESKLGYNVLGIIPKMDIK